MTMQGGTRLKGGCTIATDRLYTYEINLKLFVVLICIVSVVEFIIIFIGLKGWLVVNLIYSFIFRILIYALRFP